MDKTLRFCRTLKRDHCVNVKCIEFANMVTKYAVTSTGGSGPRQVAYLASTLFLDSSSDLIVLIVNTITRDLADDNMLVGAHAPPLQARVPSH